MKKFQFTLQPLLTLRERAEQKALEKYAAALRAREAAAEQVHSVEIEQLERWAQGQAELTRGCAAGALQQRLACDQTLVERRRRAVTVLGQCEVALKQASQGMLLARRDRQALEKQRERQRQQHSRELSREEQKNLDEVAQSRAASVARKPAEVRGSLP